MKCSFCDANIEKCDACNKNFRLDDEIICWRQHSRKYHHEHKVSEHRAMVTNGR